jgi:uncharacterized membrane protein YkvA (DUF1232 family)
MIKIPFTVSRENRRAIKEAYLEGTELADQKRVDYVNARLSRVIRRLSMSDEPWHQEIAEVASILARSVRKNSRLPASARKHVVAALYYLCDPDEVIPDYIPGEGYADDALVINLCLSNLKAAGLELTDFA